MNKEQKFMRIVERAVGQLADTTPLVEVMAEICLKEEIDPIEFGEWIKSFKGLLQTLEMNCQKHNMLNRKVNVFNTIPISELF